MRRTGGWSSSSSAKTRAGPLSRAVGAEGGGGFRRLRLPAVALVALAGHLCAPAGAPGQERANGLALRKTEVVRILSGTTYSREEAALIIRRNCLAFRPTPQDLEHFASLGADDRILAEIRACGRSPAEEAAPAGGSRADRSPPARDPAGAEADAPGGPRDGSDLPTLSLSNHRVTITAGGRASLTAEVRRGGVPLPGVRLTLEGSGALAGVGSDLSSVTDGSGRAAFELRPAAPAGDHRLRLTGRASGPGAEGTPLRADLTVQVVPGAPVRAEIAPDPLPRSPAPDRAAAVEVRLLDREGQPVSDRKLRLRAASVSGPVLAEATTDAAGRVTIALPARSLRGVEGVVVEVAGDALARVPVASAAPAETGTRFVAGAEQTGEPGRPLPQPLVLEVRDAAGAPLPDVPIHFTAEGGHVRPAFTRTDPLGRASTRVSLGPGGATTVVTATVNEGPMRRQVVFRGHHGGIAASEFRRRLSEGARLLAEGHAEDAADLYAGLVEADPRSVDALVGHGRALELLGERAAASARYRRALALDPERADARFWLDGLMQAGRPAEGP